MLMNKNAFNSYLTNRIHLSLTNIYLWKPLHAKYFSLNNNVLFCSFFVAEARMWGNVPNQWNGKLWQWPVCYRLKYREIHLYLYFAPFVFSLWSFCIFPLILLYFHSNYYVFVLDRCRSFTSHWSLKKSFIREKGTKALNFVVFLIIALHH